MKKVKCQKDSHACETSEDRKCFCEDRKCFWCGEGCGIIKEYIIGDDLENPRSYHPECVLMIQILAELKIRDLIIQKFKKVGKIIKLKLWKKTKQKIIEIPTTIEGEKEKN